MAAKASRKIFVNLAVRDLKQSMDFFSTFGFAFSDLVGHHWEVVWMDPSAVQ